MREAYQEQLTEVNTRLVQMCRKAADQIGKATTALLETDLALAEQVVADDSYLDRDHLEIDELVLQVLALQSPVATELRIVLAALRTTADIERMGDLAAHVAKVARMRYPERAVTDSLVETFAAMGRTAQEISLKAADVIASRDLEAAAQLHTDDNEMDNLHRSLLRHVIDRTDPQAGRTMELAIDIALLGRYYERFADHAVEIAANTHYLVTGEVVGVAGSTP